MSGAGGKSSSNSSSSGACQSCTCGGCGVRFEVTLPRGVAARASPLWHNQGVRELAAAAADDADLLGPGGTARTVMEMLLLPRSLQYSILALFAPLPLLLLHYLGCGLLFAFRCIYPDNNSKGRQPARTGSMDDPDSPVTVVNNMQQKA